MKLHQTASFLSLLTLASAEYPWPLLCGPKPPTVTPFDPERVRTSYIFLSFASFFTSIVICQYLGDWYVHRNVYGTVCERAQYTDLGNGNISVWNTFTAEEPGSQVEGGCAWAELTDAECDCGDLTVTFPFTRGGPYLILDTDYETFTSVYSCAPLGIEFPWILTRETNPPDETVMHNVCFMEELVVNMCSFQSD